MAIQSVNNNVTNSGLMYTRTDPFYADYSTAGATSLIAPGLMTMTKVGTFRAMPGTLPGSLTAIIPQYISYCTNSVGGVLIGKMVRFGSIDISGASGTWTADGTTSANMPTVTELGVSRQQHSAIFLEVTTVLNATPGSLAITYVDQDGNTSESTTAAALTASAAVGTAGFLPLNAGDVGVRSISAVTRSAGTTPTGVITVWGMIPLCMLEGMAQSVYYHQNFVGSFFNPIRMLGGEVLGMFVTGSAVVRGVSGYVVYVGE